MDSSSKFLKLDDELFYIYGVCNPAFENDDEKTTINTNFEYKEES